jgi:ATP-dependent DNA ligase
MSAIDIDDMVLDGEAVAYCVDGLPDFHRLLGDGKATACLYAFDLLIAHGEDLRPLTAGHPQRDARQRPPGRA